jgi:hypothetical protein
LEDSKAVSALENRSNSARPPGIHPARAMEKRTLLKMNRSYIEANVRVKRTDHIHPTKGNIPVLPSAILLIYSLNA